MQNELNTHGLIKMKTLAEHGAAFAPVVSSSRLAWNGFKAERYFIPDLQEPANKYYENHIVGITLGGAFKSNVPVTGGRRDVSHPQGATLLYPAEFPHIGHDASQMDLLLVYLEPSFVERAAKDLTGGRHVEIVPHFKLEDEFVKNLGLYLLEETEAGGAHGKIYAESLAAALAVRLIKNYSAQNLPVRDCKGGLAPRKLNLLIEYINENLHGDLGLEELADICGLNIYHFARMFKISTGMPPHQYVVKQRIETAKYLLKNSKLPMMEICLQVGFQSQNHFTTLFRKHTGATPKQYRNSL